MLESYPQWEQLQGVTESSLGLVPAIVQDARTGDVLMLGWMNAEAFAATIATKQVTFYSRSRQTLWTKGETSGNVLDLVSMRIDCDHDTLLIAANPRGPVCHTGQATCFGPLRTREATATYLDDLVQLIHERRLAMPPESYTTHLYQKGLAHIGDKVMEEAEEVARAAREEGTQRTTEESADLVFHLLVLMEAAGVPWSAVVAELAARRSRPRRPSFS